MTDLQQTLLDLRARAGALTPAVVVAAAEPEDHPLHNQFEWDDSVAGPQYRLMQAGRLIRKCKIVTRPATETEREHSINAFQAVRRPSGYAYEPSDEIVKDEFARELLLRDMERDWKALHRRYAHFVEFVDMVRKDVAA